MALAITHLKTDVGADLSGEPATTIQPSDWLDDHVLTGVLPIENGGTGQTTAAAAINALLPDQTGNSGKLLTTDGTNPSWTSSYTPSLTGGNGITYTAGTIDADINTTNLQFTATQINTIQNINSTATPTFNSAILSSLTSNSIPYVDSSHQLQTSPDLTYTPYAGLATNTAILNNLQLGGLSYAVPFMLDGTGVFRSVATSSLFTYDYTNNILTIPKLKITSFSGYEDSVLKISGTNVYPGCLISSSYDQEPTGAVYNLSAASSGWNSTFKVFFLDNGSAGTAGDAYYQAAILNSTGTTVTQSYVWGVDNTDDKFKFCTGTVMGTSTVYTIDPATGDVDIGGQFSFDVSEPRFVIGSGVGTTFDGISIGQAGSSDIRIGQDTTHNLVMGWRYNATASSAYSIIETYGGNNPICMQSSGGNVGITTISPTSKLDVNGTIASSGSQTLHYQIKSAAADRDLLVVRTGTGDSASSADDRMAWIQHDYISGSNFYWNFYGKTNSSSTQAAMASFQYNAGTPKVNFGAVTAVDSGAMVEIASLGALVKSDGSFWVNGGSTSAADYARFHQNASLNVTVIDFNSEMWIRPNASTTVMGFTASGISVFGGTLDATHVLVAPNSASQKAKFNAYDTYSNRKLKENIVPMPSVTERMRQAEPVMYNFKGFWIDDYKWEPPSGTQGGLISQDFAKIFPDVCSKDSNGEYVAIDYGKISAYLVKAWQELDARTKILEAAGGLV